MHLNYLKSQLIQTHIAKQTLDGCQRLGYTFAGQDTAIKGNFTVGGDYVFFDAAIDDCGGKRGFDAGVNFLGEHRVGFCQFVKDGAALLGVS
jgi:hypothetical protein